MWVPASSACNQINIDVDTGKTTPRSWTISVIKHILRKTLLLGPLLIGKFPSGYFARSIFPQLTILPNVNLDHLQQE